MVMMQISTLADIGFKQVRSKMFVTERFDILRGKDQLWDYNILSGIELTDVPLYYHSIPLETMQQSQGRVTNGYGLPQL